MLPEKFKPLEDRSRKAKISFIRSLKGKNLTDGASKVKKGRQRMGKGGQKVQTSGCKINKSPR